MLLEGQFGEYERLTWDEDEEKLLPRKMSVTKGENGTSIFNSPKLKKKGKKQEQGHAIVVKGAKMISLSEDGKPFIATVKKLKEPKTNSIEDVKKLDTPKKAAIAFFVAIFTKDKQLLDDALNQWEWSKHAVNSVESLKNATAEVREKIAREKIMPTLLDNFFPEDTGEGSEVDCSEMGLLKIFSCPDFYTVEQVVDVWIVKVADKAKEIIKVDEYRVIKNKETGKYEVAVVIFPDDDEEDEPEEKETTE